MLREAVGLYQAYPEVLLLDCTYKTNRFNLPLLNMIGITGLRTTFNLVYAFIQTEQEGDYTWVLQQLRRALPILPQIMVTDRELALINAIGEVFPNAIHLLYQWHIHKNIVAKCFKPFFTTHTDMETTVTDQWTTFL